MASQKASISERAVFRGALMVVGVKALYGAYMSRSLAPAWPPRPTWQERVNGFGSLISIWLMLFATVYFVIIFVLMEPEDWSTYTRVRLVGIWMLVTWPAMVGVYYFLVQSLRIRRCMFAIGALAEIGLLRLFLSVPHNI